jgi:hypothetical protein
MDTYQFLPHKNKSLSSGKGYGMSLRSLIIQSKELRMSKGLVAQVKAEMELNRVKTRITTILQNRDAVLSRNKESEKKLEEYDRILADLDEGKTDSYDKWNGR